MTYICDTPVTIEWLWKTLENSLKKELKLVNYDAKRIGIGEGFLSAVVLVSFEWQDDPVCIPKSIVFKTPQLSGHSDQLSTILSAWLPSAHRNEVAVYEMYKTIPNLALPKIYYTQLITSEHHGVIVMECLDGILADGIQGLSLDQVFSVTEALARLHAETFKLNTDWTKSFVIEEKVVKNIFSGWAREPELKMRSIVPEFCDRVLAKVTKWFDIDNVYNLMMHSYENLDLPPVPVHGDLWNPNLFWEKQNGKATEKLLAVIDWQIAHPGSLTEDNGCFLATSVSGDLRRKETDRILEFYYEKLSNFMNEKPPFSIKMLKHAYKVTLPIGMLVMFFSVPYCMENSVMQGKDRDKYLNVILERVQMIIEDVLPE